MPKDISMKVSSPRRGLHLKRVSNMMKRLKSPRLGKLTVKNASRGRPHAKNNPRSY